MKKNRQQVNKPPINELTYFDIDRSLVLGQLEDLQHAVEEGAMQLEMVAAERVFGKSLSRALTTTAVKLREIGRDLKGLQRSVAQAETPGGAERPKPESARAARRKASK